MPPIRVGILHSQTGPMAISEKSMIDAEVLALEEINNDGFLGRQIEWVVADGRSDWPTFAREAQRLIEKEEVSVIFGCWTSASRKSVKPVVEQKQHLLIYPMAYEGLEQSPNIIYTGAAPNQQVIPALSWCLRAPEGPEILPGRLGLCWPHCVNEIAKDQLKALGAECVGESYILFGSSDVGASVEAIRKANPDVIISTVVGDSNGPFIRSCKQRAFFPSEPRWSRSASLKTSCASYRFQHGRRLCGMGLFPVDRPARKQGVRQAVSEKVPCRSADGATCTSDVIEAAYNSVWLWARAVSEAGTDEFPT